ncbi:hypothetical protein bcgnr5372_19250 [Bacillus luti]
MSLNMYLGEVQSQTQSMNAVCTATIQGMEQAIQSIDADVAEVLHKIRQDLLEGKIRLNEPKK